MLTVDLSIPILKRLITGSRGLYRKVQRDANWASRCQLSVNDQSLVLKRGSRIVVPDDYELRTLLISELHDSDVRRTFRDGADSGRSWSNVLVGVPGQRCHQVCFYLCNMSEKQGSSPQALWIVTTVNSSGEALAFCDLRLHCQASLDEPG
jgi:hypothetical protein